MTRVSVDIMVISRVLTRLACAQPAKRMNYRKKKSSARGGAVCCLCKNARTVNVHALVIIIGHATGAGGTCLPKQQENIALYTQSHDFEKVSLTLTAAYIASLFLSCVCLCLTRFLCAGIFQHGSWPPRRWWRWYVSICYVSICSRRFCFRRFCSRRFCFCRFCTSRGIQTNG